MSAQRMSASRMASSLDWIVFHPDQIAEARKYLRELDKTETTVDALGFGAVLEAVSEILFPATSTLHSRVRYQIFLPAILCSLNCRRDRFRPADVLRKAELDLQRALSKKEDLGVIGRNRQEQLKYWPSVLYWSSLNTLRLLGPKRLGLEETLELLDADGKTETVNDDGDPEEHADRRLDFDQTLEAAARCLFDDFEKTRWPQEGIAFDLTRQEAHYLRTRYEKFPESLTHWLVAQPLASFQNVATPFTLGATGVAKRDNLIRQAERFSRFAMGATYAYRWALCRHKVANRNRAPQQWQEGLLRNAAHFHKWREQSRSLLGWKYKDLEVALSAAGDQRTNESLEKLYQRFIAILASGISTPKALQDLSVLVKAREDKIKGRQSRFVDHTVVIPANTWEETNYQKHLFTYRWDTGRQNAVDIVTGLRRR